MYRFFEEDSRKLESLLGLKSLQLQETPYEFTEA
jgi:hypothetical protein